MTTTPETPALPGDLTDETIERAAIAFTCGLDKAGREEWAQSGEEYRALIMKDMRAALAAARVAPVTPSVGELEQALGFPLADGQEPTEGHRDFCREHGHAADRSRFPSQRCARCGEKRAPSPDREKLIAEALEEARLRVDADSYYGDETESDAAAKAAGFNAAMSIIEPYVQKLAALAVPPVVNEAKLENEIRRLMLAWSVDGMPFPGDSRPAFIARGLVERQREWLETAR